MVRSEGWAIDCYRRSAAVNGVVETLLRKTPLFTSLTDKEMDALAARVNNRRFERGALLFSEGDRAQVFFLWRRTKISIRIEGKVGGLPQVTYWRWNGRLLTMSKPLKTAFFCSP